MATGKFLKGIVYGALIGGAIALFDKQTREGVFSKGKEIGDDVKELLTHPREKFQRFQDKVTFIKQSIEDMNDDLQFIMKQATQIKELGEETVQIIEETKEVFQKEKVESENQQH
ncbi:YtxH domain-containing protein [Fervidibacillus albus]|uniref:YtxH domain-containing protein n=1 Tax=Fervidibacillus albus TaxID=2980026 RepID=A0A9E8LSW8_9BACI|nr:YtxH domain-containing protein [Fervidibacillus albus]WAA08993.1 hypothetical protein OE104_10345 [Fervidibacillus albus]